MTRMSDERLAVLSSRYSYSGNQNSTQRKVRELLDALITERKMVEWLAREAARCEYSDGAANVPTWIAAAEEAVK